MTQQFISQPVKLGTIPQFFAFQAQVPIDTLTIVIRINPGSTATRTYYDGWVLTAGKFSNTPPVFVDDTLSSGHWDGQAFTNLMRNPSAEDTWFNVAAWVDQKSARVPFIKGRVSLLLAGIEDSQAFGWYYRQTASQLFQTFWGKPVAAQVPLPGIYTYDLLQLLTALALLGAAIALGYDRLWNWQSIIFVGVVVTIIWGVTCLRGAPEVLQMGTIPWARYALPAFIPTALVFCTGWQKLAQLAELHMKWPGAGSRLFIAFMMGFAIFTALTAGAHSSVIMLGIQQIVLLLALAIMSLWLVEKIKPA
jgi:hypothetical protein